MDEKSKRRLLWQVPFLALLIVGSVIIISQQDKQPYVHHQGFIFGTVYNVTYQCEADLQGDIEAALHRVDSLFSMFNEHSVVSHINRNEDAELPDEFMDVLEKALSISHDTDGAFDITVAPLVNAWGFGFKHDVMPSEEQVDSLLEVIGYRKLVLDRQQRKLTKSDPRMMIDFSAIAKGYGTDAVASLLKRKGVKNYMVEIGGEVVTHGMSPSRQPWRIGVTKPTDDSLSVSQELQAILSITDKAMATSGNYRNFYYQGGRKYAHTIDPSTGHPVQHALLSATVLADDCATADAYATSFMVMGMDRAQLVLTQHPELMAYFIYTDEEGELAVWHSPELPLVGN